MGLGQCLLIEVDEVDRPLLVQSVNTGGDVSGEQFDLQVGDGGCGAFNTCAGSSIPKFYEKRVQFLVFLHFHSSFLPSDTQISTFENHVEFQTY